MILRDKKKKELAIFTGVAFIAILLFLVHLYSIYESTSAIISPHHLKTPQTLTVSEAKTPSVVLSNTEHREMMTLNPFKIAAVSKTSQPAPKEENRPQQSKIVQTGNHNLKLVGTISGAAGWAAILDTKRNVEGFYSPGSTIKDGVKLLAVTRTTATILYNQTKEILHLNDSSGGDSGPATSSPTNSASQDSGIVEDGFGASKSIEVSKEELKNSFKNLSHLLSQMRVQAYFEKGKPSGFLISKVRDGSFVQKIGGKKGDIIRSVNGQKVDSVQKAFKLYNTFKNNTSLKMEITRDGKPVNLDFSIK